MKEQFPDIPRIPFEGPQSDNPLAFKILQSRREGRWKGDAGASQIFYRLLAGHQYRRQRPLRSRYHVAPHQHDQIRNVSGRQEMLESSVNRYLTVTE